MTGVEVEKVDENGAVADGPQIPSAIAPWTAGQRSSRLIPEPPSAETGEPDH
jgi:hypothetical protein